MFQRRNGEGVRVPSVPMRRRRGARLTDRQVRGVNDLLYSLLTDTFDLSPSDAERCLRRPAHPNLRPLRRRAVGPLVDRFGEIHLIAHVLDEERGDAV
jgi:hypothetical protein